MNRQPSVSLAACCYIPAPAGTMAVRKSTAKIFNYSPRYHFLGLFFSLRAFQSIAPHTSGEPCLEEDS